MSSTSLATSSRILESSASILNNTIKTLDSTIHDVARLKKVLNTQKVFGLVPAVDVEAAKKESQTEKNPQVQVLMERINSEVARLRRRKASLESKFQLNQVRLDTARKRTPDVLLRSRRASSEPTYQDKLARLKFLQMKKDRLNDRLSRLRSQSTRSGLSQIPSLPPQ